MALTSNGNTLYGYIHSHAFFFLFLLLNCFQGCFGFGTYGFDIHHRFSDPIKSILALDDLPEKGSVQYYSNMAKRDRLFHGRRLAAANDQKLTFADGNDTYRINSLGYLYYANVSVGTPSSTFFVALDTGSDIFWLPCNCTSCAHSLVTSSGDEIDLNIYNPDASSTSSEVPCNSTKCEHRNRCPTAESACPYQVQYLSSGTSSTGYLVEDVLHLITDDTHSKDAQANITFGCAMVLTGEFLDSAAPNGLFGLGMENVSVPSVLASEGLASNSFSMCFGPDGVGRITFGDKGSSDQGETPFMLTQTDPTYNISVIQIRVGRDVSNMEFSAIFDSGTSFTYLNDPTYTFISESFDSQIKEKKYKPLPDLELTFEYCYELSENQENFTVPAVNLTMKGGDIFAVTDPIVTISINDSQSQIFCLGVVKSTDENIIGQNFMTGYRIVFDRERMVLCWKESNCYDIESSNTLPISPTSSTSDPPTSVTPEATAGSDNDSQVSRRSPAANSSPRQNTLSLTIITAFLPLFAILHLFYS